MSRPNGQLDQSIVPSLNDFVFHDLGSFTTLYTQNEPRACPRACPDYQTADAPSLRAAARLLLSLNQPAAIIRGEADLLHKPAHQVVSSIVDLPCDFVPI